MAKGLLRGAPRAIGCAALLSALAGAAVAQQPAAAAPEASAGGVISYTPAEFAQYQPANAFDMISRIPGFSFSAGDQVRGFAGAVGNVLIDGQRPSSKSVTLENLLTRIPTGAVERIDLIRGGAPGIDMQGLQIIVNVVKKPGGGLTGAIETGVKGYIRKPAGAVAKLQFTRKSGGLTLDGTLAIEKIQPDSDIRQSGVASARQTRRNGAGQITSFGRTALDISNNLYQANASAEYRRAKDLIHLNLGLERNTVPRSEDSRLQTIALAPFRELLEQDTRTDKAELSADYEHQLGGGVTVKAVALHTYRLSDVVSSFVTPTSSTVSTTHGVSGESILRASVQGMKWRGIDMAAGGEAALNKLDSTSGLIVGGRTQVLPSANVQVQEKRAEGFVTLSNRPTSKTSLEVGVRVETSTIRQTGDADRSRSFTFAKPRAIFTWSPNKANQLRLRVERVVGQLTFEDFAASSDLTLGAAAAGNADLQPERSWLFEGALERRFWGKGALVLSYNHREMQQVNDRVAIYTATGVFDAPGNIASGTRDEAKLTLAVPLDRLGVPNTEIRNSISYRTSRVIDPVTGMPRQIAGIQGTIYDTTIIHDVPRWRSTFTIQARYGFVLSAYRLAETRVEERINAVESSWVWKINSSWLLRLEVSNPLPKLMTRNRLTYAPTRAGTLIQSEYRRMFAQQVYSVRLRKTF